MRKLFRPVVAAIVGVGGRSAPRSPPPRSPVGTEDLHNRYKNVGMVVFYQPDGRFRCSGTLIAPRSC